MRWFHLTSLLSIGTVDVQNKHGSTALRLANEKGYIEVIKVILERNAHVDIQDIDKDTAFIVASKYGHVEIDNLNK